MSFTDVFIRRPVLAMVLSLLLLLLGAMGYRLLGVQETPDIQSPVVTITTAWPGADPAIVESDVTEVLERELNGIEGVRTLSSSSTEGQSQITVEFTLERALEDAANDVRGKVSRARRRLPEDALEPTVEKADASAQPVLFLRLMGEGRSLLEVTEIADTIVRDRVENVSGVSGVDIFGAQTYAMRLDLDAARMAARKVTVSDIERALKAGNVELPAGRIEGAATQLTLHLEGGLNEIDEFGGLVLRANGEDRVYLRDVASVRLGAENERTSARADGVPTVTMAITPQARANIIDVSDEVLRRMDTIRGDLPGGMGLEVVYDRADAVRTSIHDVKLTLIVAFGLVVLVIFAFLRDVRSTLVPALAIPVSIVGTFLVLWAIGFTVNVFTLFGLVLAIGLVVDDAIVVLENIVRRVEEGEGVLEASLQGTRQITSAVVATTLSLVAVFLPVIFTGGTTGRLFLEFGVTVAASVLLSMVVALTLTPMLCSKILRPGHQSGGGGGQRFARSLEGVLRRPWLVVPVIVVAFGGVYLGFQHLPREFFPTEDRNFFAIRTQATEGTSFAWMDARTREVEQILILAVPERRALLSRVAQGTGGTVAGTNTGLILFPLVPAAERSRSQQQIVASLRPVLDQITAFRTIPIQFPTVGRGFASPLQFVIQHPDFETLAAALPGFVRAMREIPGLSAVNEDLRLDRPELQVLPDRERTAELGVSLAEVARTLQVATSGLDLSTFERGVRQYKVIASLPLGQRDTPEVLQTLSVRTASCAMVPLSGLVQTHEKAGAASRFHYNRAPSATISANLDGITLGVAIDRVRAMAAEKLPPGFRTALAGESKDYAESSASLAAMFLLALALVYLLLSAQFDSFVAPIGVMVCVPLALVGAFGALWALGYTLSFFGQVGLILLIGLVTKNGILIVEYARQLQEERGLDPWAAAEEAARLRFRPILMTSVATIGGAVPIAVGLSGQSRSSLGVAVVGGMLSATLLTLYVTPVVYAWLASRRRVPVAPAAAALLILLLPGLSRAATLTLAEALRLVDTQGYDVRLADAALAGEQADADQARAALLPSLSGSAGLLLGNDPRSRLGDASGNATALASAGLRLDLSLIDVSALYVARAARLSLDAAEADREATRQDAVTEAASAYLALQQAQEATRAADAAVAEALRLRDLTRHRVEVGASPPIDQTRAELQWKRAEAQALRAGTDLVEARLDLAQLLGLPIADAADLAATPAEPWLPPDRLPTEAALDAALTEALERGPDVQAAAADLAAARAARAGARADLLPSVAAYGAVSGYSDLAGTVTAPVEVIGVTATVPLLAGGAKRASVAEASADETAARLTLEALGRSVDAELRLALRAIEDAAAGLQVAEDAARLAALELSRAEARYSAGADDNLSVVSAQAGQAQAEQDRIDALAAYNSALLAWARLTGTVGAGLP